MPEDKPDLSTVAEALGGAPAEQSSGEDRFEQDRKIFEALEKKYRGGDEPKPKKKKKEQSQDAEPVHGDAPEVEAEGKTESADKETPESSKAREFLRLRASVPASVIDKLSADEAIEWWNSYSRTAAETDRVFRERAELQKELGELREAADKPEEPAVPASALDFEKYTSQLSEQFGEEEAKVLTDILQDAFSQVVPRIDSVESTIESAKESNTRQIASDNRERLAEYVPLLSDSDRAWEAVEREVIALAEKDPTAFPSAQVFFDEAVKAIYGEDALARKVGERQSEEPEEEVEERRRATPTTTSKKPSPRKMNPGESSWAVFRHLQKNPGDIRGAQRAGQVKTA